MQAVGLDKTKAPPPMPGSAEERLLDQCCEPETRFAQLVPRLTDLACTGNDQSADC